MPRCPFSIFFSAWLCCLQLNTLRGSILEDVVPSTSKHGLARGLPLKEVLEYLVPELNVHCLRLALNTPKVTEQLMKLDEQGVRTKLPLQCGFDSGMLSYQLLYKSYLFSINEHSKVPLRLSDTTCFFGLFYESFFM